MRFTLAFLSSLAVAAAQAYTPPAGQEDGMYSVTFDASGQAVTKRHDDTFVRPQSAKFRRGLSSHNAPSSVEARDFPSQQVSCTGRDINDHHDYSVVQNCLSAWLDKNSGTGSYTTVFYCRAGDTLLAICNYPYTIYGSTGEIQDFNNVMDRQCGSWRSGFIWIPDWNKSVRILLLLIP